MRSSTNSMPARAFPLLPLLVAVIGVTCLGACTPVSKYQKLAVAGQQNAAAVQTLADATARVQIDTSSEVLLAADSDTDKERFYDDITRNDKAILERLGQVTTISIALGNYWAALGKLASSTAPTDLQASVNNLVGTVNALSAERGSGLLISDAELAGMIVRAGVDFYVRGAIQAELNRRQNVLRAALALQGEVIDELASEVATNLKIHSRKVERRKVRDPYISQSLKSRERADRWIADRRDVVMRSNDVAEIRTAQVLQKRLTESFEAVVSGRFSSSDVDSLIADTNTILAIVKKIHSLNKEQ